MKRTRLKLPGRDIEAWMGGSGRPIVLLHGGWAGAEAHWSAIWDQLAERYLVVAPELPGILDNSADAPRSYRDYAHLIAQMIGAMGAGKVLLCGNSLGATIAWQVALTSPDALVGVVLVNGFPPTTLPLAIRSLARLRPLRALLSRRLEADFYSLKALQSAFVGPEKAPPQIRQNLATPPDGMVERMLGLLLGYRAMPGMPTVPVHLIWGSDDRLASTTLAVGRHLHTRVPGSRMIVIERAGHLPQVEQPGRFVDALEEIAVAL